MFMTYNVWCVLRILFKFFVDSVLSRHPVCLPALQVVLIILSCTSASLPNQILSSPTRCPMDRVSPVSRLVLAALPSPSRPPRIAGRCRTVMRWTVLHGRFNQLHLVVHHRTTILQESRCGLSCPAKPRNWRVRRDTTSPSLTSHSSPSWFDAMSLSTHSCLAGCYTRHHCVGLAKH